MSTLDDLGTVVRMGPPVMAVSHSHMLRHRKRRIRVKWQKRLQLEVLATAHIKA